MPPSSPPAPNAARRPNALLRAVTMVVSLGLLGSLTGCAQIGPFRPGSPVVAPTFRFATAAPPSSFDPFYATDGDTFRITRQIFETLVSVRPGSAQAAPGLATAWGSDQSGTVWTFHLRQGVRFSDGTSFDAAAVCANLDRMFDQNAAGQSAAAYWSAYFGGFKADAEKDRSLYRSCAANDAATAVVTIDHPTGRFPGMLAEPAFAMQSPKALTAGNANDIRAVGGGFSYPANAAHPVGTGPYVLKRYDTADSSVVLVRNPRYRGPVARSAKLVFRVIPDESARRQALESGAIDGYDLPDPLDWKGLVAEGDQVRRRQPLDLLYVGFGHNKLLGSLPVRQAIYHALDRKRLVKAVLPQGSRIATQLVPRTVTGFSPAIKPYAYDPAGAKKLLAAAHATKLSLTFAYPTGVSRPYLPDPAAVFDSLQADLGAVGITVKPAPVPWAAYQQAVRSGRYDAYLGGWTGDLDDPYGSIAALLAASGTVPAQAAAHSTGHTGGHGSSHAATVSSGAKLTAALQAADATVSPSAREQKYAALDAQIMAKYLPVLPIASTPSALALAPGVKGLVPSPLGAESFARATAPARPQGS